MTILRRGRILLNSMTATLVLLVSALAATSPATTATQPSSAGLRLEGTFLQYQPWMMKLSAEEWRSEIEAARRAKLQTVVIQWLENGKHAYIPGAGEVDPTEIILTEADAHGMQVFLGLASDEAWWREWNRPEFLDRLSARCIELAERAWKRYGGHSSLAGWYLPAETADNLTADADIASVRSLLRRVSDGCRRISGDKPVAIAPFFGGSGTPQQFEDAYTRLLTDSGISIVMLQDGVGARGWDTEVDARVVPYFRAMRSACLAAGAELWSDLECFRLKGAVAEGRPPAFEPAHVERITRQLTAEAPFVKRFVTFDFFHYMSPRRGGAQKSLYESYLDRCVARAFFPTVGRSVEIDPAFAWYMDRSAASIASEIRASGYQIVLYVVTADSRIDPALIDALHERNMGVLYCTFGNGTYSTIDLPAGWEAWRMVTRSDLMGKPLDGYTRLCLNDPAYRTWRKSQIARVLNRHAFDGVHIMEPHWPEYPGIESPAYACFCTDCANAFRHMFPEEKRLPDILDAESPFHPSKNPGLRAKWLTFRRATLTAFLDDLVNGPGGVRATSPGRSVCTWTLALAGEDGPRRVLEDSGEDAAEVVRVVKPDMHCLQTHWPDWMKPDLPPDYAKGYRGFIEPIRAVAPRLPLMIQADTGSGRENRRSWDWIEAFERACNRIGAGSTTLYEFFIGEGMYTDAPRVTEAAVRGDTVELHFSKRVDAASAGDLARYRLTGGTLKSVRVDGNVVLLSFERTSGRLEVAVSGVRDAFQRRLFQDRPPATLNRQHIRLGGTAQP